MSPLYTQGRRLFSLAVLLVSLMLAPGALAQGARIGSTLQAALDAVGPLTPVQVVVTFNQAGKPSGAQRAALAALGLRGITFQRLPIAGVLATRAQVAALAARSDVRSLWLNEPLTYSNDYARDLTGVDRLRTDPTLRTSAGLPYSGQGVAVLVNDSGIDATHADLPYGTKVLENVQGLTNLAALDTMLPVTYLEGMPNTDLNSGHGTHCAGTVAGTGVRSGGLYEGVAPGASLVGYGSGGGLFILDGLGGFDYAISRRDAFADPIRVITNSWGSDGEFDPASPIVEASYRAYQAGIVVLFAASNSGPGEDTHNIYAQAPWVISVGAGDRLGALADFSSRGQAGEGYSFTTYDGRTWTYRNEPTVVAPGVDIISTRALTNGTANGGEGDVDAIPPAFLPFYTMISGTSMATPHTAGIVALMLEANPALDPLTVRRMLQLTASNMPGREAWEAGAGYVNAHAAVALASGRTVGSPVFLNSMATFYASAQLSEGARMPFSLFFTPVGEPETTTFEVAADVALVKARATVSENTIALVLTSPSGVRYGSGITLPVLGETAAVSAPGEAGTWTLSVSGIGSVSGVPTDPLGVTNGTALPGTVEGEIALVRTDGFTGLDDVAGHPAQGFVETAVLERLMDGKPTGFFPNSRLTRRDLAHYLAMGGGVRQPAAGYVRGLDRFLTAALAPGAALKDREGTGPGVLAGTTDPAAAKASVTRADLALSLGRALGLAAVAEAYTGPVYALYNGQRLLLDDSDAIPSDRRGYVQLALDAGLLPAQFTLTQGPTDTAPTVHATFGPAVVVRRADYAAAAVRLFAVYDAADPSAPAGGDALAPGEALATTAPTGALSLDAAAPNPTAGLTRIGYTLSASGPVRLAVYDVLGREVAVLVDTPDATEGRHTAVFDARALAAGAYVTRLVAGSATATGRLTVTR